MKQSSTPTRFVILTTLILVVGLVFAHLSFAWDATSTSFKVKDSDVNVWGGLATSTNFQVQNGSQPIAGSATSSHFYSETGLQSSNLFIANSRNWRWYDDETNVTPVTALANENVAPTNVQDQNTIKLRITIAESGTAGLANAKFRVQYSVTSDFSTGITDVSETSTCSGSSGWCYADGGGVDNATITSKVLTDSGACAAGVGNGCGTHNESGISTSTFEHTSSTAREYEFTLKQSGAGVNTTYFFRAFDVLNGVAVSNAASTTYPSLVTGGTTLTFTISGLSSGVATEGVVTDASTTATTVNFGTLTINNQTEAAQRLTITSNATLGYQLFLFQDQGLLSTFSEIPAISSTNAVPDTWGSACVSSSTGCYGYHTGDDLLSGGSTRFAANDSYARFETSTREIAWSSVPVATDTIDMVFKALARNTQVNGNYQTAVTYIIVPVF